MPKKAEKVFTEGTKPPLENPKGATIKAQAFQMGFMHGARVRTDSIVNVTKKFFEANRHWLDEFVEAAVPADTSKKRVRATEGVAAVGAQNTSPI